MLSKPSAMSSSDLTLLKSRVRKHGQASRSSRTEQAVHSGSATVRIRIHGSEDIHQSEYYVVGEEEGLLT